MYKIIMEVDVMMANNKYKYYKYLNSTFCRFAYDEPTNAVSQVGEIFDHKNKKWSISLDTIRIMLSGEANEISEKEIAIALKNKI